MSDYIQTVTTTPTQADAEKIAQSLVEKRLAACVQIVGPITSVYRWQGKIETAQEWQCLIKSRQEFYERIDAAIRQLHPYLVPEIISLPIVTGSEAYLRWIDEEIL